MKLQNKISSFLVIAILLIIPHCSTLFKDIEFVRRQNILQAAHKYASGNWIERKEAVKEIAQYIGPDKNDLIEGTLLVAARDVHSEVRIEAIKRLASLKTKNTVKTISAIASVEKIDNIRWNALQTLAGYKEPETFDVFVKGLGSEDWLIREASIKGILKMENLLPKEKITAPAISAINDVNSSVMIVALRNLKTKDSRIYNAIIDRFNAVKNSEYTLLKAFLIALHGYKLDKKTRDKVVNLLVHNNSEIRIYALRLLKKDKILKDLER